MERARDAGALAVVLASGVHDVDARPDRGRHVASVARAEPPQQALDERGGVAVELVSAQEVAEPDPERRGEHLPPPMALDVVAAGETIDHASIGPDGRVEAQLDLLERARELAEVALDAPARHTTPLGLFAGLDDAPLPQV